VYRTDAGSSDRVRVVEIPRELNLIADYPIGIVDAKHLIKQKRLDLWSGRFCMWDLKEV
jgi:hypothetical protein